MCQFLKEETVSDFILGGSKITADGDCSHEITLLQGIFLTQGLNSGLLHCRHILYLGKIEGRRRG